MAHHWASENHGGPDPVTVRLHFSPGAEAKEFDAHLCSYAFLTLSNLFFMRTAMRERERWQSVAMQLVGQVHRWGKPVVVTFPLVKPGSAVVMPVVECSGSAWWESECLWAPAHQYFWLFSYDCRLFVHWNCRSPISSQHHQPLVTLQHYIRVTCQVSLHSYSCHGWLDV